jgi:uncharacterized membrane protein YfcA
MRPIEDLLMFALALAGAGVLAGILAGLFGIGGGAILVPVFYQVFAFFGIDEAVRMHLSVGTSLAIIVPTSISSYLAHRRRGAVDTRLLRYWITAVPIGTLIAAAVAAFSSGEALKAMFAAIATMIGIRMLLNRAHWKLGDDLPPNPGRYIAGVVIGLLSGLMGVGGGVLVNTYMTVYGRPIHQAVATAAGVGVLVSIPGLIGYVAAGWGAEGLPVFSTGYVNWIAVALIIPITMVVAPFGVAIAHRASKRQLEIGFGIFLLTIAARFVLSLAE